MPKKSLFQQKLLQKRKAAGLTQQEMAKELLVSTNTVARWERGEVRPFPAYEKAIAKFLDAFPGHKEDE